MVNRLYKILIGPFQTRKTRATESFCGLAKHRSLAVATFHPLQFILLLKGLKRQSSGCRIDGLPGLGFRKYVAGWNTSNTRNNLAVWYYTCFRACNLAKWLQSVEPSKDLTEFLSLSLWCKRNEPNQSLKKSANPSFALAETSQGHATAAPHHFLKSDFSIHNPASKYHRMSQNITDCHRISQIIKNRFLFFIQIPVVSDSTCFKRPFCCPGCESVTSGGQVTVGDLWGPPIL